MRPRQKVGQKYIDYIENSSETLIPERKFLLFIQELRIYLSAILDYLLYFLPFTEFGFRLEVLYVLKL